MQGLIVDWEMLPREPIIWQTTSASGAPRRDAANAIPLCCALAFPVRSRLNVTAEDGYALALGPTDVQGAFLACLSGMWTLVLPQDGTRRRFVKHPVMFEGE